MRDMPHVCVWHDSFMCVVCVTCLIHACDMTRSHVRYAWHGWHASFMCVAWLRDMTHSYVTWPIHLRIDSFIYDLTHSDVTWLILTWHGLFIRNMNYLYVTQPIHMWHDSFICDMTHSYVWQDSFIGDMPHSYVTSFMHMWHMWHDSFVLVCSCIIHVSTAGRVTARLRENERVLYTRDFEIFSKEVISSSETPL